MLGGAPDPRYRTAPIAARAPAPLGRTWISQSYGADAVPAPLLLREPLDEQSLLDEARESLLAKETLTEQQRGWPSVGRQGLPEPPAVQEGTQALVLRRGQDLGMVERKSPQRRIGPGVSFPDLRGGAAKQSKKHRDSDDALHRNA